MAVDLNKPVSMFDPGSWVRPGARIPMDHAEMPSLTTILRHRGHFPDSCLLIPAGPSVIDPAGIAYVGVINQGKKLVRVRTAAGPEFFLAPGESVIVARDPGLELDEINGGLG